MPTSPPAPGAWFERGDVGDKQRARNLIAEAERRLGNQRLDICHPFSHLRFCAQQALQTEQSTVLIFTSTLCGMLSRSSSTPNAGNVANFKL